MKQNPSVLRWTCSATKIKENGIIFCLYTTFEAEQRTSSATLIYEAEITLLAFEFWFWP